MGCVAAHCLDRAAPSVRANFGERETVLLLHGSAGSGSLWRHALAALGPLYRCLAPDLIGYGASRPWPLDVPFGLEAEQQSLEPLLACCAETFHVVGYSYGGVVALQLALADPERIRTLTLIEPVFFNALRYAADWAAFAEFANVRSRFEMALERGSPEAAMHPFIDFWAGEGNWDKLPIGVRADMLRAADKIALDWRAAFAFAPGRTSVASLGDRTMLVRGDRSPSSMLRLVDALHVLMPGSTRLIVPGANHLLPLTRADDVTDAILSHLHVDADRRLR